MEYLLGFLGVLVVLGFFASRPAGVFHVTMVAWFIFCVTWMTLTFFGVAAMPANSESVLNTLLFLGLIVPFVYFVMRGAILTIDDVSRGVQKVNQHLDSTPTTGHGRQYLYDENTGQWYVYTAHVEQWTPTSAPR